MVLHPTNPGARSMTPPEDPTDDREAILKELAAEMAAARRLAIKNFYFAFAAIVIFVLGTALSGIVIAYTDSKPAIAAASSLPMTVAILLQICKWDTRSKWWWMKYHGLGAFSRELRYEARPIKEVSAALSRYNLDMERTYPAFGALSLKGIRFDD
jgi:hypothetical protein